jgi:glyoxylase-like metal-dependent hydrolase (beta-lactamase superfamily II)
MLFAFTCGWWDAHPSFFMEGDSGAPIRSPIPAYLIEHPRGLAVFDTGLGEHMRIPGPSRDYAIRVAGTDFSDRDDIAAQIAATGRDPGKVQWIINSHLHSDHCGGNASLPNATVVVQRNEVPFAEEHEDGALYALDYFRTGQSIKLIDGEHDLFGDGSVVIVPTIGHTPGHQSALVRLASGDVLLTADCCYLERALDQMRLAPGNWNQTLALETLGRLHNARSTGTRLFYGHDAEFWRTVPQGAPIV